MVRHRYIIDITQLVHWSGNLTGIPRVMDELAIRFLHDSDKDVVFVSWVRELGCMCEVDFARTRPHRGDGIDYVSKNKAVTANRPEHTVDSPQTISPTRLAKKVVKKIAVTSRLDRTALYKKALSAKRALELQSYKPYTPAKGDAFFIPWGEWWDQNWLDCIKSYAELDVHIYPVCHDILPMIVPQFSGNSSSLAAFVTQVFPLSTRVLTVSESTKSDLTVWMKQQGLTVPDIKVFRLGEDFTIKKTVVKDAGITKKYSIEKERYIVYVSTIEPRKNHALLYYVYKLAKARGITLPKLLIIGRVGHDVDKLIKHIAQDPEVNNDIAICNEVNDAELNWLYQNCLFAVMPSFYEGWGMSVLESIARGKSVVCSNTSSLLEMPDDCVIRFSPASTDECLAAITEMMQPSTLKKHRASAKKYKPHSWDASYKQVLELLKET